MDEQFRRAGRLARAETEATVDLDAAWREMTARIADDGAAVATVRPVPSVRAARDHRWLALAAAAAAVVVIAGVTIVLSGDDTVRTTVPDTTAPPSTAIAPTPSIAPSSVPSSVPSMPASTSVAPPTTADDSLGVVSVPVSYLDPPPLTKLTLFGSDSLPADDIERAQYALGESGVLRVVGDTAHVIGNDFVMRDVAMDVPLTSPVFGSGDVVYGLTDTGSGIEAVAVSLGDRRTGEVVARSGALGQAAYVELPTIALGHGPDGIVDLARDRGRQLLGYVDQDGATIGWDGTPRWAPVVDADGLVVAGGPRWSLDITRDPSWPGSFDGDNGAANGPGGLIVYPTTLGPPGDPSADIAEATMPVIAVLDFNGPAATRWLSVPDGWQVASISPWGVLVVRPDTTLGVVELGLLDVSAPPVDPLTAFATTDPGVALECPVATTDRLPVCASLGLTLDDVPITYDPATGTLTRHDPTPVAAVTALGNAFIETVGPDDVVYLAVLPPPGNDPIGDIVAVSAAEGDIGRELRRWPGAADLSGDSDLVPTPDGLVAVGCCGPDLVRPAPDAPVAFPWIGRDGGEIRADIPVVRWDRSTRTVTVGDQQSQLDLPAAAGGRGMPEIVTSSSGGFAGAFVSADGTETTLVVGVGPFTLAVNVLGYPVAITSDGQFWFRDERTSAVVATWPFAGD